MPLIDLDVPPCEGRVPRDVQKFLREAERRIRRMQQQHSTSLKLAAMYLSSALLADVNATS